MYIHVYTCNINVYTCICIYIYIYIYIYICVNTSSSSNNSNQVKSINTSAFLDCQDQDILKILEELQSTGEDGTTLYNNISSNCVYESRIEGHLFRCCV